MPRGPKTGSEAPEETAAAIIAFVSDARDAIVKPCGPNPDQRLLAAAQRQ
jgi:hypothetical protein